MPAVAVEEVEDTLEGGVGDFDVRVVALQVVNVEQAAVEEGYLAQKLDEVGRALRFGLSESFVKQAQKEEAVELLKAAAAALLLHHLQAVAEVVGVAVEEALLLDEVDEHHAVEHEGGVPVPVALGGDAVDEVSEGGQLGPEAFVEAPGDLLDVEGFVNTRRYVGDADPSSLIFKIEGDVAETLEYRLPRLACVEILLVTGKRPAALPLDPLPFLR